MFWRSEYHTQLAKMSFDKIFDLTAGVYFNFYNMFWHCSPLTRHLPERHLRYIVGEQHKQ